MVFRESRSNPKERGRVGVSKTSIKSIIGGFSGGQISNFVKGRNRELGVRGTSPTLGISSILGRLHFFGCNTTLLPGVRSRRSKKTTKGITKRREW